MRKAARIGLGLLFAAVGSSPAIAQHVGAPEEGWRFTVAPYLWLGNMSGSTSVLLRDVSVDVPFGDIVDKL